MIYTGQKINEYTEFGLTKASVNTKENTVIMPINKIIIGNNFCTLFFFLEKQIKRIKQIENNKIA